MKADLEVLLSHTEKQNECLLWTKCLNTDGYPRALVNGDANTKVHRLVWELFTGKSAKDLVIRHKCDNPRCINPEHLEPGTPADNVRDRDLHGRNGWAKITREQVKEIRDAWSGGFSARELAEIYGISRPTVYSIVKHRHWKHV